MPTEEQFAGLNPAQMLSGKKQMLYAQMELLTALQKYETYKKLRKEEFAVKNLLKKSVFEVQKEMDILTQFMPQIKTHETSAVAIARVTPPKDRLESEIAELRKKIAALAVDN